MQPSGADVVQNKLLRPPFSLHVPISANSYGHAGQNLTANGPLLPLKNLAGGVPQDPIRNSPMTPPGDATGGIRQDFIASGDEVSPTGNIQSQEKQSTSTAAISSVLPVSLPTIFRDKDHRVFLVSEDLEAYLKQDLDHARLNRIHGLLWMAGRPLNARPLQRQKMMGFDILLTEQADLHLLKFSNKMFVKPLPEYMLHIMFWNTYLCKSEELYESACGILLSYIWLICSPLDLKLAHNLDLLPHEITWIWWKSFVADFLSNIDANTLDQVNKRYHFGELRLGRINSIYRIRFFFTHFIRGYLYGYNRYAVFFQRNFAWMLIILVYFSLVLTAMQVGATVPPLSTNHMFQRASYGFAVFSMATVAAVVCFVGFLFVTIFFTNMVLAISHEKKKRRDRKFLAQESR
ncbi:hypothetical protein N7462_009652 [Penicillium macrosclerotiorum]|uniref:uncharacterized protein n=1 Tax=Penicillium macrosclerotiorum TaxID=303699 RepID=UPI0025476A04|nr:uncharacterized protein N7462_009652 [Penicillium macrosclerotiorum]KAJ5674213.1 hypothetical protein N7462_009652 [Penicillium macrosclerotiorum]